MNFFTTEAWRRKAVFAVPLVPRGKIFLYFRIKKDLWQATGRLFSGMH